MCYLQPERSSRGNIAQTFFDTFLSLIYLYSDSTKLFISGDFNGRIGDMIDYDEQNDNIPQRKSLETTENKFGEYLIDFLKKTKFLI